jgi:hypothetical protein
MKSKLNLHNLWHQFFPFQIPPGILYTQEIQLNLHRGLQFELFCSGI